MFRRNVKINRQGKELTPRPYDPYVNIVPLVAEICCFGSRCCHATFLIHAITIYIINNYMRNQKIQHKLN